jgi:hypothetical protein
MNPPILRRQARSSAQAMRVIFGLLFASLVAGCDAQGLFSSLIPEKQAAIGREYLDDIRIRKFEPVETNFDRAFDKSEIRAALEKMSTLFPRGQPKSVKTVGSNTVSMGERTTYNFTFEYEFEHGWVLGHIYFVDSNGRVVIERLDVLPLKDSLENLNAFSIRGKSVMHYAFLALAALLAAFSIFTAIICLRTPIPKRKWLWVIFILIGFVSITLNWTTGELSWNALTVVLFSAGFWQQLYRPLIVQIAIPIGAALFWLRRHKWTTRAEKPIRS